MPALPCIGGGGSCWVESASAGGDADGDADGDDGDMAVLGPGLGFGAAGAEEDGSNDGRGMTIGPVSSGARAALVPFFMAIAKMAIPNTATTMTTALMKSGARFVAA